MTTKVPALLAALLFTAAAPAPVAAQQKPAAAPAAPKLQVSREAGPALVALEKAIKEKRNAEVPALAATALAAAKTPVDRYFAYRLQLPLLVAPGNEAALLTALEGLLATGIPQGEELGSVALNAAKLNYNKGAADTAAQARAAAQIEQAVAATPNNGDAHYIRGLVLNRAKKPAEAVASMRKAQEVWAAAGKPFDQSIADQLFAIAYNNRLPVTRDLAVQQVKAAPTAKNWRTAIKITEQFSNLPSPDKIDLFRLQRATNSFEGEGDYFPYVDALLTRGLPGEAKAVLDEAFAANKLDRNKATWKEMHASASARVAGDRASLAAGEKAALAAATARPALATADAFMSYGDYARAAALYRAALTKSGVDADLANLRLGIALARSGDKAGATSALQSVKGTRAGIAQMWLLFLQQA